VASLAAMGFTSVGDFVDNLNWKDVFDSKAAASFPLI
jgi:hypothetical protein